MCHDESVFRKVNGIIYYSNTNRSKAVARYFANELGWELYDLNRPDQREQAAKAVFEKVILVFPVYSQNIPNVVKAFLKELNTHYLSAVATYGKMCYGRVLYEIQQIQTSGEMIAAAYFPAKHSYVRKDMVERFDALFPVIRKNTVSDPKPICLERTYKNPFSNFAMNMRSRMNVRITFDENKCIGCGKCEKECLFQGIRNGKTNRNCIRCLKCVTNCPTHALDYRNGFFLRMYLKKKTVERCEIYV